MMRWTSIIIGAICAISSCGEFRNIGLLDDMLIVPDNDAAEAVCAETESLTLALPVSFEWRLSRPVGVWLVGESSSGETLVWSASNLPPGIGLTDEAGVLAGAPSASGTYTSTLTATSSTCPGLSESRAIRIDVTVPCIDEDCGPSPECGALRHEAAALEVEYVSARGGRRSVSGGETLALDGLLVETVLLNSANASAQRTLVLAVPNSKDTVLVHYTLPGGVYAPVTGQRIDLRYLHGDYDDQYLFLTIDHLKRFSLVHRGVLTRDELQRRCPGNPIGLHCRLPEIDWVPLNTFFIQRPV